MNLRHYFRHSSEVLNLPLLRRRRLGKRSGIRASGGTRGEEQRRKREEGFTLVEMMVVIVIIGLLATVVIINVLPATDRAAQTRVKADLDTLSQALDMYRLENMRYPNSQEGLAALSPNYVRRLPNDPWNNPYVYVSPGPNGAPYRVASLGADGREGGTDENADITN